MTGKSKIGVKREKDNHGQPALPGGWFAPHRPGDISAAAIASMYAQKENEHASACSLIDSDYTDYLRHTIPAPRGRRVSGRDTRMWSGISFVASVPIFASLASAATLTPMPLVVAASAAALPVAGIAVRNAILGLRVTQWEKKSAARRESDRPRVDAIKTLAYAEARELQDARWALTETAVAELQRDVA